MPSVLIRNARLLTLAGPSTPRRGAALRELSVIPEGDLLLTGDTITAVGPKIEAPAADTHIIDAAGRVVMPGFVDCHTHACFMTDRAADWTASLETTQPPPFRNIPGASYLATVRDVRAATQKQLAAALRDRLTPILRHGTTTLEVKSGYGLSTEDELKQLRAIRRAASEWPGTVVSTALLGYSFEGNVDDFARMVVKDMLPEVAREFPEIAVDARCENGAWSVDACVKFFKKAQKHHPIRAHSDQFTSLGLIPELLALHARSIDHLESVSKNDLLALAASETTGVILPVSAFHLGTRFARTRLFLENNGALALATDFNPDTAPSHSMPFAIALAVRACGLSPAEAIVAATVNAAHVLGLKDRGTLQPGQRADVLMLHHKDERALAHEVGANPVAQVIVGGQLVA